jgi:hypothetical protein
MNRMPRCRDWIPNRRTLEFSPSSVRVQSEFSPNPKRTMRDSSFQSWETRLRFGAVPRIFRQFKRHARGLHLGSWILAALVVFVSSEFVLRVPGMAGPNLHPQHHQASSKPQAQSSSDHHPASHDHRSCQLCTAPPIALAVSSLSQFGKTRLELVDTVLVTSTELGKQEHRIGLRSRAPPVFSLT